MALLAALRSLGRVATSGQMARAALIAGIFFVSGPVWGQISLVQVTNCGARAFPGSCTITATGGGHLIVVSWAGFAGSPTVNSIIDNAGNTYAQVPNARSVDTARGNTLDIWYAKNSNPGATSITITPNVSLQGDAVIWEFAGIDSTSPVDQVSTLNTQPATTTPSGAPVTITTPNEVIVSVTLESGTTGLVAGNPFTADSTLNGDGYAHLFTSAVGTYQAIWNDSFTAFNSSAVSFKAASSSNALNACDLNADGLDNVLDVNRSVNMTLGLSPCAANINGANVCNIVTVQRVVNSSLPGGACVVDAASVQPTGLSCNPSSVNAPGVSACTGTLSAAAPSGGLTLTLSSNNPSATVLGSVTAASGATTFGFTANVGSITTDQTAVLTASANGASSTASLTLAAPAQLSAVSCSPVALGSGQTSTCTVTLTKVPTSATTVSLSSNMGTLSVPASVTINGVVSGTFIATAGTVSSSQTATIIAGLNGINKTTTVNLSPTAVSHSVTLTWAASTSANIAGYNIYRGTTSGGPYAKLNSSLITGLSYVDTTVLAGQTYYYVGTAVDGTNAESTYSNQTQATVPTP